MANRRFDTNNVKAGQDQSFVMPSSGPLDRSEFKDQFQTVDTPDWKDTAKLEAFMNMPVKVKISESQNPFDEQIIQLAVNGINQFMYRGVEQTIKRKFVEVLARCKPETVKTYEFTDSTGSRATGINKFVGLKYPFEVREDKHPDGHTWLNSILQQG